MSAGKCLECDEAFTTRKQRKYCSNQCQLNAQSKELIKQWLRGERSGHSESGHMRANVRNYLLRQSDYKCSLCGWGQKNLFSNTYPLEIDHIDGDHNNSSPQNLRVLCPNCHSLTNTFGSRNKGKGRRYFREKYHAEKNKSDT